MFLQPWKNPRRNMIKKIETIDSHVRNLMDSTHQQQNTVDAKEITQKVIDLENRLIELENSQEPPTSLDLPKDKGQIHVHKSFLVVGSLKL